MNRVLKISLPIVLIGAVAALWFLKQDHAGRASQYHGKQEASSQNPSPSSSVLTIDAQAEYRAESAKRMIGEKAFDLPGSHLPIDGDASTVVERLAPAANAGDPQAALEIYLKVSACRRAWANTTSDSELAVYKRIGTAQAVLEGQEKALAECESLDFASELVSKNWLEMAAQDGSIEAKLLYAVDTSASLGTSADMLKDPEKVERYKKTAVRFLNEAADSGSLDALMKLANAYDVGMLVPKNPSMSYAYYLAIERVDSGSIPTIVLDGLRSQMSPREISAARSQAQEIYSRCCVK
jgi:TPR repeat protein